MFGAFSALPVFKFYQNDEFNTNISCAYAMPDTTDPSLHVSVNQDIAFFGFKGSELRITDFLNMLQEGWTFAFNVYWTINYAKTLLGTLYDMAISKFENNSALPLFSMLASSEYERLTEESFELFLDSSSDFFKWSLTAGHKSIVRIFGTFTFDVFATLGVAVDTANETTSFVAALGTSLSVHF
jgi:hypothetical protein